MQNLFKKGKTSKLLSLPAKKKFVYLDTASIRETRRTSVSVFDKFALGKFDDLRSNLLDIPDRLRLAASKIKQLESNQLELFELPMKSRITFSSYMADKNHLISNESS